jgi:transposase
MRIYGMRKGITISVSAANRQRLEAIVSDRNTSQKHAWRARIILLTGAGVGTNGIMAATGKSKTTVWRWQERFAQAGVEGLLSDKTRPPGKPPVADARVADLVRLTLEPPPHEATHWTARAMARAVRLGVATVQKIWKAHGLAPHRFRAFKLSNDPAFAEKLHAIVGLYVSPPAHAVVLSVDEKSQIQALDRTQPGLPMKKGRGATMTHDYKRHGTTTLFAALDVLEGTVFGKNMQRHRHQEFIRFLNALEAGIPAGKLVHAILDNYAAHKTPQVRRWLARHPRWTFHFTPTSSSWLNAVEGFFAKLTRRRLKHGVFTSVVDLQAAINRFIAEHNRSSKPFIWRADPDDIIAARARGFQALESNH